MTKYNKRSELEKAWAEHMDKDCNDSYYLEDLNRVEVTVHRGGYTPMVFKDLFNIQLDSNCKQVSYIEYFGYCL